MYLGNYTEDYADLNFKFTSRNTSGVPTALSGNPTVVVYKSNGGTKSLAGVTLNTNFANHSGLNNVKIDLSSNAFYAINEDYSVVVESGIVAGVNVAGENLASFSIENRFEEVDVTKFAGESFVSAAPGFVASAGQIIKGTVDTVTNGHSPSSTEFQADDITEGTSSHYNGRIVIFTSGALAGQATDITAYSLVGGIGQFTVTGMTEAPSNNDTFIII